jgi:hypothetical protein
LAEEEKQNHIRKGWWPEDGMNIEEWILKNLHVSSTEDGFLRFSLCSRCPLWWNIRSQYLRMCVLNV